jgi:hypothetical protein
MTSIKQVLSAKEVQHQLGMDQYPPVWLMMMKLRDVMGHVKSNITKLLVSIDIFTTPSAISTYSSGFPWDVPPRSFLLER